METDNAQEIGKTSHSDTMEVTKSGNWITPEGTIFKVTVLYSFTSCYYGFTGI